MKNFFAFIAIANIAVCLMNHAAIAQCACNTPGYGCGGNQSCIMGCAILCSQACDQAPTIAASDSLTFCTGDSVILTASRMFAITYQWKNDAGDIAGATSQNYVAHASGKYKCKVTNNCNTKVSSVLNVTVEVSPAVTLSANGPLTFCNGDSVTLTANTNAHKYHWRKNGADIAGATNASYTATTSGTYKCRVTNSCGKIRSQGITVAVPCRWSDE